MTRRAGVIIAVIAVALSAVAASFEAPKFLLWNASASVPIGLYLLRSPSQLRTGALVAALPPPPLARYIARRGYLPKSLPLLKHILALPSQTVCRSGRTVTIDGINVATALDRDHHGRALPVWHGCRTLRAGEIFLLNPGVQDSFDGRYFGPLPASSIIGRTTPLWIRQEK